MNADHASMVETMLQLRGRDHERIQILTLRVLKWKAIAGVAAIIAVVGWVIALSVVIW